MRLLPQVIDRPHFEPLQRFLTHDADLRKRYQLSERLADLFDQYQVYRADWLEDWAEGRHQLRSVAGEVKPLPPTSCWQAELWRALLDDVGSNKVWRRAAPAFTNDSSSASITSIEAPAGTAFAGYRFRNFFTASPSA
jgi:exodeoxyribonuclease V gamma subunit